MKSLSYIKRELVTEFLIALGLKKMIKDIILNTVEHLVTGSRLQTECLSVIHVVEVGSRLMGINNPKSDYDVQVVYAYPPETFHSLRSHRDDYHTITNFAVPDEGVKVIDLKAWELKKVYRRALASNPTLIEWINSDLVIKEFEPFRELKKYMNLNFNRHTLVHHNLNMVKAGYKVMKMKRQIFTTKDYLRLAQAVCNFYYIKEFSNVPPSRIEYLLEDIKVNKDFALEVKNLIETRKEGKNEIENETQVYNVLSEVSWLLDNGMRIIGLIPDNKIDLGEMDSLYKRALGAL